MNRKAFSGIILTAMLIGMLTFTFNIQPVEGLKVKWTVDDDGPANFHTIQEAINAANPGDTIYVYNGTYYENVVVNKTVSLIGEDRYTTIIDGSGVGTVVHVTASGVCISNFTLRKSGDYPNSGIKVDANHCTITSNVITNSTRGIWLSSSSSSNSISENDIRKNHYGIELDYSSNNSVAGNNITNNKYTGFMTYVSSNNAILGNNITNNGLGIWLYISSNNNSISENCIANNTYEKALSWGILLDHSNNNSIYRNNVIANNGTGIWFQFSSHNAILGNNIIANNATGIHLCEDSSNNSISGNEIRENIRGIRGYAYSNDNSIYKNIIANNECGIELDYSSNNNSIFENNITNNGVGMKLYYSSNHNHIYHNNFVDNYPQYDVKTSVNVWDDGYPSGGNYWSDYTGVDLYSGSNQDYPSGSDGMGDSAYTIDVNNRDRYPLMNPWVERTVGVKVGDWAKYKYEFSWSSTDPNEQPPQDLVDFVTHLEWFGINVLEVFDTIIVFQTIIHFKNGTETKSLWTVDVNNGSGNGTYSTFGPPFIAAGLNPGETLCTFPPQFTWCGWQIEETISRPYVGVMRETNHLNVTNWSVFSHYFPYNSIDDFYWDRATGILCELLHQESFEKEGYVTSLSLTMKMIGTNIWKPSEHELVASITAPAFLQLGSSSLLNATVTNKGLNDEVDVELLLIINGTTVNSTVIPLLKAGDSYTFTYPWTPTVGGTYNVTAYARPVPGETYIENNQKTISIKVVEVGVKAGDWIKYDYTITGWPAGTPYPEWLKVEFLSVEGTSATVRVTMHMSDGTEQNVTVPVDVVAGGEALGLSGFIIPANLTVGDSVYISGYGNVTIAGETTGTYAGASRTVVYASFSQYGTQITYYWDELTGVMVEASAISGDITATAKATETNMWQAETIYNTIYIRADGSIDPPDAPIITDDNITYTLTDNIASSGDGIVVEKDKIVIDGAGYTIQGPGKTVAYFIGVDLSGRTNVTIVNMEIKNFWYGIYLSYSHNNTISNNNIANSYFGIRVDYLCNYNVISSNNVTNHWSGIRLYSSCNYNSISGNTITANEEYGIRFWSSCNYNSISGNNIANNDDGVWVESSNNIISGNNFTNNWCGIRLSGSSNIIDSNNVTNNNDGVWIRSSNNIISGNNITANKWSGIRVDYYSNYNIINGNNITANQWYGIWVVDSSDNIIYHNNVINNAQQIKSSNSTNTWDDGYPSGGNYWSDYTGVDANGDGIGDTPYVIDVDNQDRYPLMNPWGSGTPVASFAWSPYTPEVDELVTFDALASMPIGGEIVSFQWDFGDGSHATGEIVTHAYGSAGTFTVTLNVTDSEGLWDIEQKQIEVKAPPPPLTVSISPTSASILVGESVTFTSTVSGGYTPYSYQWYLNGNPVSGATADTWTFTPTENGIYYVYLKVTDDKGNTVQSDTARITVASVPVGGYSIPIKVHTKTEPIIPYVALITMLTAIFIKVKRKTKRKR